MPLPSSSSWITLSTEGGGSTGGAEDFLGAFDLRLGFAPDYRTGSGSSSRADKLDISSGVRNEEDDLVEEQVTAAIFQKDAVE